MAGSVLTGLANVDQSAGRRDVNQRDMPLFVAGGAPRSHSAFQLSR